MIGILDSGIGGLAAVRAIRDALAGFDLIYIGDTAHSPYGGKSQDAIWELSARGAEFLMENGTRILVCASHTISGAAGERLRGKLPLPMIEPIEPAVEHSLKISRNGRIGVIATRATVSNGAYEKKILHRAPEARVYSAACPLLVPLVEEGWSKKPEAAMIIKKYLHPLKVRQVDTLILGCTHYARIQPAIRRKIGRRVKLVDGSGMLADSLHNYLELHPDLKEAIGRNNRTRILVTDLTPHVEKSAKEFYGGNLRLEEVRI